jgi:hypothetical protein
VYVSKVYSIRGTTLPVNRRCALVQTKAQIAVKEQVKYYILLYSYQYIEYIILSSDPDGKYSIYYSCEGSYSIYLFIDFLSIEYIIIALGQTQNNI